MVISSQQQVVSFKRDVFSYLRRLRAQGYLTLGQLIALQRIAALGPHIKRSYAALAKWCQVSRSTITRTLAIAERIGLISRHTKRRRYWDGERVRVVKDAVTLRFLRFSSSAQKKPESGSYISLGQLLAPFKPLDPLLAAALDKLERSLIKSGRMNST